MGINGPIHPRNAGGGAAAGGGGGGGHFCKPQSCKWKWKQAPRDEIIVILTQQRDANGELLPKPRPDDKKGKMPKIDQVIFYLSGIWTEKELEPMSDAKRIMTDECHGKNFFYKVKSPLASFSLYFDLNTMDVNCRDAILDFATAMRVKELTEIRKYDDVK